MRKLNDSKRLEMALRNASDFDCHHYLMVHAKGRSDGMEKAERHRDLCKTFTSALCCLPYDKVTVLTKEYKLVHEATQSLTGYLDKEIGFPLDEEYPNYDVLVPKFFKKFYAIARKTLRSKTP